MRVYVTISETVVRRKAGVLAGTERVLEPELAVEFNSENRLEALDKAIRLLELEREDEQLRLAAAKRDAEAKKDRDPEDEPELGMEHAHRHAKEQA